ncbi:MAG: CBS domain-containing protein [Gammaproteobacteria bacterium]|jgi:CBS domain-containing protein
MEGSENLAAQDIMSVPVVSIPPTTSVDAIARIMRDHGIGALPVTDETGSPIGIVTQTDLLSAAALDRTIDAPTAKHVMQSPPRTIEASTPVSAIAELFGDHQIEHALVTRDGRLVGMLSVTDLVNRTFTRVPGNPGPNSDERLRRLVTSYLRAAEPSLSDLPDMSVAEGIVRFWREPTAEEIDAVIRAARAAQS